MDEGVDRVLAGVGDRLLSLRRDRGTTLAALAGSTGISISTLSWLQTGRRRRATLELLLPTARAHGVTLDELIGTRSSENPRVRAEPLRFHDVIAWPLTRNPGQPSAYKMIYPPARSEPQPTSHEGFEWVYVLSGRLRLVLGDQDFTMGVGEAAEFDTRIPHWLGSAGAGRGRGPRAVRPPGRAGPCAPAAGSHPVRRGMRRGPCDLSLRVSPSSRAAVGLRSERGPVLLALMVSTGLIAIDATILATAVPSIVRDVGGFAQFPWLFSVYLLAQAVSVSVYAKLADSFGRKPIMLLGIGLFLLGSVLCGLAWSMPALIAFRAVQGIGAGAVQPMAMTIAGDIYTVAERATAQGYIASVWAMSSVVGPTLGGVFSQLGLWRWIFLVNVPLCLLAGGLIARNFRETVQPRRHRIDYLGSVLLTSGMTLLILGVLEGGQAWAWSSRTSITVFAAGAALLVAFALAERRAAEPILPLWVLSRRLLATTTFLALGVGAILIGLTSYVPTYLENSLGVPPLVAGLALAALTLGWPLAATLSGRLFYLRLGFRPTILIGLGLVVVGSGTLALLAHSPSVAAVAVTCFVTGLGMGLVATPSLIAAQASVEWHERGVATGTNMFARSIGSAVGAAVLGAVANGVIAASGRPETDPVAATESGAAVFLAVLVAAVLTVVAGLLMPKVDAAVGQQPAEPTDAEPASA